MQSLHSEYHLLKWSIWNRVRSIGVCSSSMGVNLLTVCLRKDGRLGVFGGGTIVCSMPPWARGTATRPARSARISSAALSATAAYEIRNATLPWVAAGSKSVGKWVRRRTLGLAIAGGCQTVELSRSQRRPESSASLSRLSVPRPRVESCSTLTSID